MTLPLRTEARLGPQKGRQTTLKAKRQTTKSHSDRILVTNTEGSRETLCEYKTSYRGISILAPRVSPSVTVYERFQDVAHVLEVKGKPISVARVVSYVSLEYCMLFSARRSLLVCIA